MVPQRRSRFHTVKLQARGSFKSREWLDPFPGGEFSGPLVPIADDHYSKISGSTHYVQRKGPKNVKLISWIKRAIPVGPRFRDCHQRSQIQANAGKRPQQTEAAIQLISLATVRGRFLVLAEVSITNRLLQLASFQRAQETEARASQMGNPLYFAATARVRLTHCQCATGGSTRSRPINRSLVAGCGAQKFHPAPSDRIIGT